IWRGHKSARSHAALHERICADRWRIRSAANRTRQDVKRNSVAGAVMADSDELLSTLAQKVSPAHAALLVIDVQNDFVANGGFFCRIGADVKAFQMVSAQVSQFCDVSG